MKEIIYVKNKERKNIISNVRIKAQKLDQDEYEISRNDCKEFIRIVKRYTIECMFEELFIDKNTKEKEINADDLISIISSKKKRCFYIPIAIYIGKRNELDKYEKYLMKEQVVNDEIKKKDKENLRKQYEIDKKRKEENEMKRYVSIDSIYGLHEIHKIDKEEVCDNAEKKSSYDKIKNDINKIDVNNNNNNGDFFVSTDNNIVKNVNSIPQQEKKIEIDLDIKQNGKADYKNEQGTGSKIKKKIDEITKDQLCDYENFKMENNKKHENKKNIKKIKDQKEDHNENMINDPKNFISNTKNNNNNNNNNNETFSYKTKITNIHTTNHNNISEEKKNYYNTLLKKVADRIETNSMNKNIEKNKYLKSFHLVSYYKLNELIYVSFLIRKYYNHYYEKELYDIVDIYEDIQNNKKENIHDKNIEERKIHKTNFTNDYVKSGSNNDNDNSSNVMIHFNKNDNIIYKDIFKKLDEERKQKKDNIYNDYAHKYIHSDMLYNYRFVQNDLYKIIQPVLYNLNIFFNQNVIKDINKIMEKYDTVIQDVQQVGRKKEYNQRINEGLEKREGHKSTYEKGNEVKADNMTENNTKENNTKENNMTKNNTKENNTKENNTKENNTKENNTKENNMTENKVTENKVTENKVTENKVTKNRDKKLQNNVQTYEQENIQTKLHNDDKNINTKKIHNSNNYHVKEKRNDKNVDNKNKDKEECINYADLDKGDKHITNTLKIPNNKIQMKENRKENVLFKKEKEKHYINKEKDECDKVTNTFKIMGHSSKNLTNNNLNNLSKSSPRAVYPLKCIETECFKVMILKKKKKKDSYQSINYNSDSYISSTMCDNLEDDNNKAQSDTYINYLNIKYSKEELKSLNNRNFIYYITNDIETLGIYKKIYFYDFFFIYLLRKLFWNIFSLYYIYLQKYNDKREEKRKKKIQQNINNIYLPSISSSSSNDETNLSKNYINNNNNNNYKIKKIYCDHLLLYESDVSVNNSQINKEYLYNTNKLLHDDLKILFNLIKKQKILIYFRYDQNKKIKCKNKTQYVHRDIWIYLILKALKKKNDSTIFNEFIFFKEKQ
ncbi:conserved Plasmodium protein, unknown function [Plasmodium reichenowi]|uniref:Uncharacterized protein n=1 Tax=Plasmodium reichenowi TaxID=5854 RepID=A0A060RZB5_PLARE|nr:conserved Plasmodium protein, unknown function [Plasmodium reichenowi]